MGMEKGTNRMKIGWFMLVMYILNLNTMMGITILPPASPLAGLSRLFYPDSDPRIRTLHPPSPSVKLHMRRFRCRHCVFEPKQRYIYLPTSKTSTFLILHTTTSLLILFMRKPDRHLHHYCTSAIKDQTSPENQFTNPIHPFQMHSPYRTHHSLHTPQTTDHTHTPFLAP